MSDAPTTPPENKPTDQATPDPSEGNQIPSGWPTAPGGIVDTTPEEQPFITDDAKTAIGELNLIGGHLHKDPNGGTILLNVVVFDEMTGDEEDILSNDKMDVVSRFNLILSQCMKRIGNDKGTYITNEREFPKIVSKLPNADKTQMLMFLRLISVEDGEKFKFKTNCPQCNVEFRKTIDLTKDVKIHPMQDPLQRIYDVPLTGDSTARCVVLNGDRERLAKGAIESGQNMMTATLMSRVLEVDGVPASMGMLKSMKLKDRNKLRNAFRKHEGEVDTTVIHRCTACGARFELEVDIFQPDFFFPSETSKN
jgi:hypothetical protein